MASNMRLIVLAAGQGTRLRPLTDHKPKCLVNLAGRPLLEWQIEAAHAAGIDDIVVIGGYCRDQLEKYPVRVIVNPDYATTNMVHTLFCARTLFDIGFIMSYGDIVYTPDVLRRLLRDDNPIAVTVDGAWRPYWEKRFDDPLSDAETLAIDDDGFISDIGQKPARLDDIAAQYVGLVAFRHAGVRSLVNGYEAATEEQAAARRPFGGTRTLDQLYMTDLLQGLIHRQEKLAAVTIDGGWVEIDSPRDLELAERLVADGRLGARYHG
jgi:choline kinase